MKLDEILKEDAGSGAISAGAIAGFRGNLFTKTKPLQYKFPKVEKIKYSTNKPLYKFL